MIFTTAWTIRHLLNKLQPFEEEIVAHKFGLAHPDMIEHWDRLNSAITTNWKDLDSALINVPVEWAHLHPQRAVKIGILDQFFLWVIILFLVVIL